jgi:hypothetical protein
VASGHLYDYRVTVELANSEANGRFLSSTKVEEGQVVTVGGHRCLVSAVSPDPLVRPDEPQIVFLHCKAVDELMG